jgi:hypothetical protein
LELKDGILQFTNSKTISECKKKCKKVININILTFFSLKSLYIELDLNVDVDVEVDVDVVVDDVDASPPDVFSEIELFSFTPDNLRSFLSLFAPKLPFNSLTLHSKLDIYS